MILVTGATGAVGSRLLPLLVERGAEVRALAHSPGGRAEIEGPGVEAVDGDFEEPGTLDRAMEGCERLFLSSPPHPHQARREKAAVDAAVRAGVAHVVALSAMGSDHRAASAFGRWHAEIDEHLVASGLDCTLLRPAAFMHVHLLPVHATRAGGRWHGMTGDGPHAYVDAQDVAAVAAAVLTADGHAGQVYELTGPEAITMPQAARQLSEVIGRDVVYVDVPEERLRADLAGAGVPVWLADAVVALYRGIREGHMATVTSFVEALTGRRPRAYREFAEASKAAFDES